MTDLYRSMLKKKTQAHSTFVPVDEYTGVMSRYVRKGGVPRDSDSDPPSSLVLFHADLTSAGRERGVLDRSTPTGMWGVIMRHAEQRAVDADDCDAE